MINLSDNFNFRNLSNNKLSPTSKRNPCLLCGNTSGHCKSRGDGILCHNGLDGALVGNGYRFVKNTKDNQWGIYYPDNGQEYDREKAIHAREQRRLQEQKQLQQALPIPETDKNYRQLAATLPKDRAIADLTKRGLSLEQIEKFHFFDIRGGQSVPDSIPENFPGTRKDWKFSNGRNTFACAVQEGNNWKDTEGYAIPCYTLNGEIAGYQIRNTQGLEPKYKWAINSKLPNGEMPLAVFIPNPEDKRLFLCDSPLKALLTSAKHNVNTIGTPNGNYKAVEQQIKEVVKRHGTTRFIRAIDGGDILKEDDVMKSIKNEHLFLASLGPEVGYGWWGQLRKKVDPDIDELPNLDGVQCLSYQELLSLAKKEQYIAAQRMLWIRSKEFNAQEVFNSRYFSDSVDLSTIPSNTIALFKSGLDTGKTTGTINFLEKYTGGAISVGYRNSLLYQFNEKANDKNLGFYHIAERNELEFSFGNEALRLTTCIHSLLRIPVDAFDGKILILDEVKSVLNTLLYDSTVKNRVEVILHFWEAIRRCDKVLCFDGNLSNKEAKYFCDRFPEKQVLTFKNNYKGSKAKVFLIDGYEAGETVKKNNKDLLIKQILDSKEPIAVCSDNQKHLESLEKQIKERTNLKTVRVDRKTKDDPEIVKFIADPDKWIKENKPDIILYSPSLESGVDIVINPYFKCHYGLFFGIQGVDSIHQMVLRVRDIECPKYLWVASFVPAKRIEQQPIASGLAAEFDRSRYIKETNAAFNQDLGTASKLQQAWNNTNFEAEIQLARLIESSRKYENANLRKCVEYHLKEAGHDIEILKYNELDSLTTRELKRCTKEVKLQNADDIYNAKDDFVGKTNKTAFKGTYPENCAITKAILLERLPNIRESGTWSKSFVFEVTQKNPNLISEIENYWMLMNSNGERDLAKELARIKYHKILSNPSAFLPWLWKPTYLNVKALRSIGLFEFVEEYKKGYRAYHADNEAVKSIHRAARFKEKDLKMSVDKCPVRFINKLLKSLGIKTKPAGRQSAGDRLHTYYIDPAWMNGEIFTEIYNAIDRRLTTRIEKNSTLNWSLPEPKMELYTRSENCTTQHIETLQESTFSRPDLSDKSIYNNQDHLDEFNDPENEIYDAVIVAKSTNDIEVAIARYRTRVKEEDVLCGLWNLTGRIQGSLHDLFVETIMPLTA